jgi:hypothetical protein
MKMSCATFKATTENPPMAPFAKGGGPKDRGIFASNRHFHKRRQASQALRKEVFSLRSWRLGAINVLEVVRLILKLRI